MKKRQPLLLVLLLIIIGNIFIVNTYASGSTVLINGVPWDILAESFVESGVTYVNAEKCFDQFGFTYTIQKDIIQIEKDERILEFNIGHKDYVDQGKFKIMKNAIIKKDGVTYIPLRFFSELNAYKVSWSEITKSIEINSSHVNMATLEASIEKNATNPSDVPVNTPESSPYSEVLEAVPEPPAPTTEVETVPLVETPITTSQVEDVVVSSIIPKHFVELNGIYYLESIEQDLKFASDYYEDITHLEVIGRTLEKRPIYAIKVGVDTGLVKPCILLMANIHAREDFTSMLDMKMLDHILYSYYESGYFGSYNVRDILSKIDIWFLPVANPDGLNITQHGIWASSNFNAIKNMVNIPKDYKWWKANANGVDLNRNFEDGHWNIKTSYPIKSSEGYKGPSPNSELETRAIQKFCNEKLPLMSISYHTSGNVMYWADSSTHLNFEGIDQSIITRMEKLTGYTPMPISKNPKEFSAGFENWFKARFNRFSICMELSPYVGNAYIQHSDYLFNDLVWQKSKYTGLQLAVEALQYKSKMFDVYQSGDFLKSFYSKEKAKNYALKYDSTYILNQGIQVK